MGQLELNQEIYSGRKTFFVDVMLPVPIPKLFTYRVPLELNDDIKIGCRVIVPFGKKKILTGVIAQIHEHPPKAYEAKLLHDLLDDLPSVNQLQLNFFHWMADYYMCTVGEVLNMALPTGLKLSSESKIQIHPNFDPDKSEHDFSDRELMLIDAARQEKSLSYPEIERILEVKNFTPILKSLLYKNSILIFEEIKEKFAPKKEKRIRMAADLAHDRQKLQKLFENLEKQPKQLDIVMKYLQQVPVYQDPGANQAGLAKQEILKSGLSPSSLNTLVKNRILEEYDLTVSRFEQAIPLKNVEVKLSPQQVETKNRILDLFAEKDVILFHGITGSGKTEIYIELIKDVLANGDQVLYLLPEIAITTQIVNRLRKIFGDKVGVYHSKFSDNERVEVWRGITEGKFSFVVGVRSSVFLPFDNLGLIIIDEEHENSYKQFDPAPRYNARDSALMLAQMHGSKVLMGSATPSVESYYHVKQGKYGLVELFKRFGSAQLPDILLADLRKERKQKTIQGEFTTALMDNISESLQNKEQVIIFQNRRGYAPYISCEDCAWIPKCNNCAVSLTYHMFKNELRCHYCGHYIKQPSTCPACGSSRLKTMGYGTEKLEEDLKLRLPEQKVKRMDLDTTRKKYSYQNLIEEFEKGEIDVLVGTQMVSKGLDFDRVSLVGILDADRMIHFPDFRSHERTFQLITQVSGRAGRREKTGRVIIQTANTDQHLLNKIILNDFKGFFHQEIQERKQFHYPPFYRLIRITLKHAEQDISKKASHDLVNMLKTALGQHRVLGPEEPLIGKVRNLYLMQVMIKLERKQIHLQKVKSILQEQGLALNQQKAYKKLIIVYDVDPY